jgi:hypothetical protein
MTDLLRDLALARLEFQLRAIKAVVVAPSLDVAMQCPMPDGDPAAKADVLARSLKAKC